MGDTVVILSGFTTHCLLAGMFILCVFVISVFLLAIACVSVLIILTSKCLHVCPVLNGCLFLTIADCFLFSE